jgi:hypothetical protein
LHLRFGILFQKNFTYLSPTKSHQSIRLYSFAS